MLRRASLAGLAVAALAAVPSHAVEGSRLHDAVSGRFGVLATESPAAARAGRRILENGGNAVDAAVATAFAMGVARPQSCGLGGGGFLVYRSPTGKTAALDFRETAPAAFTNQTLLPPGLHKTFTGHLTVGVPGFVAGMNAVRARYGTQPLSTLIGPAEQLARQGFRVPTSMVGSLRANSPRLKLFPAAAKQFLHADGTELAIGEKLVQPDLAATLRRIQRGGTRAFYRGTIAKQIVADMQAPRPDTGDPGLIRLDDLAAYRAKWRTPLTATYRSGQIIAMPPPTSGGIAIVEMLNILEGYDLAQLGQTAGQTVHLVSDAQRIAWADRNAYVADPDFVTQPTAQLTSQAYADTRRGEIDPFATHAFAPGTPASARAAGGDVNPQGSTTQISVIDRKGGAVSLTCTIEQEFGSAVVAPGTGFLLNNELTDFSDPGTANEPGPGKRPRSSMAPTIVVRQGKPVLVTGGAGGARIIMGVLHSILGTIDFGQNLAQAADAQRFDDQGSAKLEIEEERFAPETLTDLEARGYTLTRLGEYGVRPRIQLAGLEPASGMASAVSDSRSDRGSLAARRAPR